MKQHSITLYSCTCQSGPVPPSTANLVLLSLLITSCPILHRNSPPFPRSQYWPQLCNILTMMHYLLLTQSVHVFLACIVGMKDFGDGWSIGRAEVTWKPAQSATGMKCPWGGCSGTPQFELLFLRPRVVGEQSEATIQSKTFFFSVTLETVCNLPLEIKPQHRSSISLAMSGQGRGKQDKTCRVSKTPEMQV